MPIKELNGTKIWQKRDRAATLIRWFVGFVGLVILVGCWHVISEATIWAFVSDAPQQAGDMISRMFPPRWSYLNQLWNPLWDTINIATLGTVIGVSIAFVVSFLAARNTTPHPILRAIALLIIVVSRSVNSLIWGLLLVAIIGPGILAGVIAIGLRSIGFVGKLFYEAIEEIDREPVEAITATGANQGQVLTYSVLPQVLPAFVGTSVFRWDINIRESTVIGLVGAGGIGINLDASINALKWSQASVIFIAIFIMVLLSEWISASIRKNII
ncbi:MAG: phosphonate ABC transporter, permease protein PhnE [Halothece sp.]